MKVLDAALAYAANGLRIFPINQDTKAPLIDKWPQEATDDPDTITTWYTRTFKTAGIGIATGHSAKGQFFVIDVDVKNAKNGYDTLHDLEHEFGPLPDTITVLTPTGGQHLYLRTMTEIRNNAGTRMGEGIDIRGEGGYVIAPPSRHPNGKNYTFEHDHGIPGTKIADAPDWLIKRLTYQPKVDKTRPKESDAFLNDPNLPSNRFAANTNWHDLLTADGWRHAYSKDGTDYYTRPGKERGVSASVNHDGNDSLIVFSTGAVIPAGGYSRFGYWAQTQYGGDWKKASDAYLAKNPTPIDVSPDELISQFIDWPTFWNTDQVEEDWLAYPLIARGRQTTLFAVAKMGKSYLTLACVAALASGKSIFGRPKQPPTPVIYLDYEMNQNDLYDRLENLGYSEDDDLSLLYYALIPNLSPLNSHEGAAEVMAMVERTGAKVVVIDTTGRAVVGEENSADTYREFARTTGLSLKAAGVALLRTDHAGKDKGKSGQRGSSAKNDDPDLVYFMERELHTIKLTRIFSRISWAPQEVELVEDQMEDNHKPIRLKDVTRQFTQRQFDLARAMLAAMPDRVKLNQRLSKSKTLKKELRALGVKIDNGDFGPACDAIALGRLSNPEV